MRLFCFFFLLQALLHADRIETFYGSLEIEEPVLLELIGSPPFQRLKSIHQYGIAYYTTHREEYTRYDHSLGVFALLRVNNASLLEQIAGLLHDVSHTVFSHVGDWLFAKENQEKDYQNSIHRQFLAQSGLETILQKHHISADQILPLEEWFPALEQKGPNLCADRLDYNIQGAYYQNFITYEEAIQIFKEIRFEDGKWVSGQPELMKKLVRFSLFMTENCWGSPINYLSSRYLADAILRGVDLRLLSYDEIHFETDQTIWNRLIQSEDPFIAENMEKALHTPDYFYLVDPADADLLIRSKFRGIDPCIRIEGEKIPLTSLDPRIANEYRHAKEKIEKGWAVQFVNPFLQK